MKRIYSFVSALLIAAFLAFSGCAAPAETNGPGTGRNDGKEEEAGKDTMAQQNTAFSPDGREPYAVRAILREYTAADPKTETGVYGRYTELAPEEGAPDSLRNAITDCNQRAKEKVTAYVDAQVPGAEAGISEAGLQITGQYRYTAYAYIVTLTRADDTAFSILETELISSAAASPGSRTTMDYTVRFQAATYDTQSGKEITLSDLTGSEADIEQLIKDALFAEYGIKDMARTGPPDYAWTADALGIRFYFHSDSVPKEKRQEANMYGAWNVTTAIPFTELKGDAAPALSKAPDDYIAMLSRDTLYQLPGGDFSVKITEKDGDVVLQKIPGKGTPEDLIIEYADNESAYYIMRSQGGFYLIRDRISYQEGFLYDFSRSDGGFGRFANHPVQYFDSFLREIRLALPYDPDCVQMCEKRRSFGETSYDISSFIPYGYYSFRDQKDERYKRFSLVDESLSIDSYNVACRLLEDFTAAGADEEGKEQGDITVKAGSALIFETVQGEGDLYLPPSRRNNASRDFVYTCRLSDGSRVRFNSRYEGTIFTNGAYMNRFTEPVSLWEAAFETVPAPPETFVVMIGGEEYPVISDYSNRDHAGEEIDFGGKLWWEVEGYPGSYRMTAEDLAEMEDEYYTQDTLSRTDGTVTMEISADGHVVLQYFDETFEGDLPEKRYYRSDLMISMVSSPGSESRTFQLILREGEPHSRPGKIEMYSEGLPATNEPSKVPPLSVFLTKEELPER